MNENRSQDFLKRKEEFYKRQNPIRKNIQANLVSLPLDRSSSFGYKEEESSKKNFFMLTMSFKDKHSIGKRNELIRVSSRKEYPVNLSPEKPSDFNNLIETNERTFS